MALSGIDRAQKEDSYQAIGNHHRDCQTAGLAPIQTAQCQGPITTPNGKGTDLGDQAGIGDRRVRGDQGSVTHRLGQVGHMVTLYHESLNAKGSYTLHSPKNTGGLKAGKGLAGSDLPKGHTGWQEETSSWVISLLLGHYCSP